MPEYDGIIIIDSKIDTSGFDKTADELFKKSDSLANKLSQSIGKISQAKMQPINMQLTDNISPKLPKIQQDIAVLSKYVDNIKIKQEELKQTISSGGIGKNITFEKFVEQTKVLASEYERTLKRIEKLQLKQSLMPQVQPEVSKNTGASSTLSSANKNIGSISKSLKNTILDTNVLDSAMNKLGKSLTKVFTVAKFIILRQAIRALIKDVQAGFSDLGKYSAPFGAVLNSIASAFKNFSNAVISAFAPIITALAPIINGILGLLTRFATTVGQFTSALFGNSKTAVVANTNFKTYGNTIDKTNKKAKALKDTLAKFDKLDILKNKDIGGIGGSTGATAEPAANMFKEVAIPQNILDFAEKVQKAFGPAREAIERFKGSLEPLKTFAAKGWEDFYNKFLVPVSTYVISNTIPTFLDNLGTSIKKTNFDPLNKALGKLFDNLSNLTKDLLDTVNEGLKIMFDILSGEISNEFPSFVELVADAVGALDEALKLGKPIFVWFWDDFIKPLIKVSEFPIISQFNKMKEAVKGLHTILKITREEFEKWTGGRSLHDAFFDHLTRRLNDIKDKIKEVVNFFAKLSQVISGSRNISDLFNNSSAFSGSIPGLATGTVVSPNSRFLAMLGDNTSEQEIVSPLSTIEQAVANVLGSGNYGTNQGDVVLQIDGQTFARLMNPYNKSENNRVGVSMVRGIY